MTLAPARDDITATYLTSDGITHMQWPHKTQLSDGTEIYDFCANYDKHGVKQDSPNRTYNISEKAIDTDGGMELYGIATYSPARINLDTFMKEIDPSREILNETTFNETERFISLQLTLWIALGQLRYDSGSGDGYQYVGSGGVSADGADGMVSIAQQEIDTKENDTSMSGGDNDIKYSQWYGGVGDPWCAMFIS